MKLTKEQINNDTILNEIHEYINENDDGYGSHLPVFRWILSTYDIKSVLEFGCGLNSTPLFIESVDEVKSLEMQDEAWYKSINHKYGNNENYSMNLLLGPTKAIEYMQKMNKPWDLIFVDGYEHSRPEAVMASFDYANIVVAHDTEPIHSQVYQWQRLVCPENWVRIDFADNMPNTSIFIKMN